MSSWRSFTTCLCCLVVALLACLTDSRLLGGSCPDACLCQGASWNCSKVVELAQLRSSAASDGGQQHVKSLTLFDSRVDLEADLWSQFPFLEELRVDGATCKIRCPQSSTWLLDWNGRLVDAEELSCYWPKDLHGTLLPKVLSLMREVQSQCPEQCSCELVNVPRTTSGDELVVVSVNCSSQGLDSLPLTLPANFTINLDLSNNEIEDLSQLAADHTYSRVRALNLNNNRIRSIENLENSNWLGEFSLLSLQGNLLEGVPTQALANALRNQDINGVRMYLSNNPWKCDCITITHFQNFIAKHKDLVKDVGHVTCGPDWAGLAGFKVLDIELGTVCADPEQQPFITPMEIICGVLALCIVGLMTRLFLDYRRYKKTGQLPWLATKLPSI